MLVIFSLLCYTVANLSSNSVPCQVVWSKYKKCYLVTWNVNAKSLLQVPVWSSLMVAKVPVPFQVILLMLYSFSLGEEKSLEVLIIPL